MRAVVGVGLLTPREVYVVNDPAEGDADVGIKMADGDETVPAHSAWQGEPGGATMGDPIHLQRRCGISHMDQTKDAVVVGAYTQFLLFGRTPRKLPEPNCEPQGKLIQVSHDIEIPPPALEPGLAAAADGPAPARATPSSPGWPTCTRCRAGRRSSPTTAGRCRSALDAKGWTFTVTDLEGDRSGRKLVYGPLTGKVVITPGHDATCPRSPSTARRSRRCRTAAAATGPAAAGTPAAVVAVAAAGPGGGGSTPAVKLSASRARRHRQGVAQGRRDDPRPRQPRDRHARAHREARAAARRASARRRSCSRKPGELRVARAAHQGGARRAAPSGRLRATATLTLRDAAGRTATARGALKLR